MKFIIFTEFGELLDLAMHLKYVEGHDVVMHIPSHDNSKIGDGIIDKKKDWWNCIGKGYVWIFDGCSYGSLQDWLRAKGEDVFGGSEKGDRMENERQLAQKWFKQAGFKQPFSKNFKSIDDAIRFVKENKEKRWILKQNGDAPKHLNHMGKFEDSEDMVYHLESLKKRWNETEYGKFDCDLMEVVDGLEVAASVFFNGKDYMKNKDGKVVGYLNFEEKKEANGGTGETTGETGTTFIGVTEDNELFRDIVMRPKIIEMLRILNFRGVFDINGSKTKDGYVAFEPTMRFGIPATSYEFLEGLEVPLGQMLQCIAKGQNMSVNVRQGVGMVIVVAAKPFPVLADLDDEATSIGEKLWVLRNGKPVMELSDDQRKHVHLENFYKEGEEYRVATKDGYLLVVSGVGKSIQDAREKILKYIKENLYIAGMKYRTDIGERVEEAMGVSSSSKIKKEYEKKLSEEKENHDKEIQQLKNQMKTAIYG